MATYGTVTPVQERYLDFRASITSELLNKKQVKFWTDESTFVVRGLQVTYDPTTLTVTVTNGAFVKDYVLIVLPNDVTLSLTSTSTCMSVVARYQYVGTSCSQDCEILVIDPADFDPATMIFLACIDNGTVIYPLDPTHSCCGQVRKEFKIITDELLSCCDVYRFQCTATTTSTEIPLLVEANEDARIHLYVNGVLLTQGVDYTIDRTTPGAYKFVLLSSNVDPNDIIQQLVICGQAISSSVPGFTCNPL